MHKVTKANHMLAIISYNVRFIELHVFSFCTYFIYQIDLNEMEKCTFIEICYVHIHSFIHHVTKSNSWRERKIYSLTLLNAIKQKGKYAYKSIFKVHCNGPCNWKLTNGNNGRNSMRYKAMRIKYLQCAMHFKVMSICMSNGTILHPFPLEWIQYVTTFYCLIKSCFSNKIYWSTSLNLYLYQQFLTSLPFPFFLFSTQFNLFAFQLLLNLH